MKDVHQGAMKQEVVSRQVEPLDGQGLIGNDQSVEEWS